MRPLYKSILIASFFFFSGKVSAQAVNKDSLSLVEKLGKDKDKLVRLQSTIEEKEKAKKETADKAQESADDNRKAANKLSNDPQDRRLARRADNRAGDAKSDAKAARRAADDLDDLHKDIRNLIERIAKEESRLKKYVEEAKVVAQQRN
jgi:hypothetical protein